MKRIKGFRFITDKIKTNDIRVLLWIICWITFSFLHIDNLTTTIVMVSLIRKLVRIKKQNYFCQYDCYCGQCGWRLDSIGDVTTTMLWIGGKITSLNIMKTLLIPSLICMVTPYFSNLYQENALVSKEQESVAANGKPAHMENYVISWRGCFG
ncbi:MAG: hypothetical protein IPJ20_25780 [Flammeovirgaceae bacterium]|nr:hypothetical protein [Flammeovirgaceae bacterium]